MGDGQDEQTDPAWPGLMSPADLAQFLALAQDGRLADAIAAVGTTGADEARPRHPRRDEAVRYRVRLELAEMVRPVVRTVELPSDLHLDEVHDVLQAALGWLGYHLHRFSTGDPFARGGETFLCPFEVDEGEEGVDAREVRLDELLATPGDTCSYAYDYGDGWEVELRLLEVLPAVDTDTDAGSDDGLRVRCTGGAGAPPPEDCGGPGGYAETVQAGSFAGEPFDADAFDADQTTRDISAALRSRRGARPGVRQARYQWLLDRVGGSGLDLTGAGHLKPVDVRAAFEAWDLQGEWVGTGNREAWTYPVLEVREGAMALRLLRRYKGRLLLTRLGAQAQRDPDVLRAQLSRLVD